MHVTTRQAIRVTLAAVIAATIPLSVSQPAAARPAPDPPESGASSWTCPTRVDEVSRDLLASGFTPRAAHNAAVLTQRECVRFAG